MKLDTKTVLIGLGAAILLLRRSAGSKPVTVKSDLMPILTDPGLSGNLNDPYQRTAPTWLTPDSPGVTDCISVPDPAFVTWHRRCVYQGLLWDFR